MNFDIASKRLPLKKMDPKQNSCSCCKSSYILYLIWVIVKKKKTQNITEEIKLLSYRIKNPLKSNTTPPFHF